MKNTFTKIAKFCRQIVYEESEDIVFRKDLSNYDYVLKNKGLSCIDANADNLKQFLQDKPKLWRQLYITQSYLANGYHGILLILDETVIGYVWWARYSPSKPEFCHPHLKQFDLQLTETDAWGFDLFILPEYRGGGMSTDVLYLLLEHIRSHGCRFSWGCAQKENLPALWVHKLHRFEKVKSVRSIIYFRVLLYCDIDGGCWFAKNSLFFGKQRFDYRFLF
ncbi:MAG: GNAT family N-acetyltransferase [Pseudomonadota bacterium]